MQERLQKIIASAGLASRRQAELLITAGRVAVNGQIITELGTKANFETDTISVDGKKLVPQSPVVYILNKPLNVVCAARDPLNRQVVTDLVPAYPRVNPVGRLDRMTEGLVILTNDGDLALRLAHPRFEHEKEYLIIGVTKLPVEQLITFLSKGTKLQDGTFKPDKVEFGGVRHGRVHVRMTIHEGRSHLIRRYCSAIGLEIIQLQRVRIGQLTLGDLPSGQYRQLSEAEIQQLTVVE